MPQFPNKYKTQNHSTPRKKHSFSASYGKFSQKKNTKKGMRGRSTSPSMSSDSNTDRSRSSSRSVSPVSSGSKHTFQQFNVPTQKRKQSLTIMQSNTSPTKCNAASLKKKFPMDEGRKY